MRITVNAKLQWINELYGRRFPIHSERKYCPIIVFKDQPNDDASWSAVILFEKQDKRGDILVKLTYLSEDAPFEYLYLGHEFSLFEGNKKVADGVIVR